MEEIIIGVIGIIVTILAIIIGLPEFIKFIKKSRILKRKIVNKDCPPPDKDFRTYHIGNIEIPVSGIVTSIKKPFTYDEVNIIFKNEIFEEKEAYPKDIKQSKKYLLEKHRLKYNAEYVDNKIIRLDSLKQGHEDENDERGKLFLNMSITRYSDMLITNGMLDEPISIKSKIFTLREKYKYLPYSELGKSVFSNPPGVEVIVLSKNVNQSPNWQVILRKRSNNVIGYKNHFQVSASGYISLGHIDKNGKPNPFITACEETQQEIAEGLSFEPTDFKLLASALPWHGLCPNFIGYFESEKPVNQIIGDFRRDSYEGDIEAIPFNPNHVLKHIAENDWTPMSAYAMIAVLSSFYRKEEIDSIASSLKQKTCKDFLFHVDN